MIGKGYQENVTIDEGTNAYGYRTQVHYEGDFVTRQRTFDREPIRDYAKMQRDMTAGTRWGDMQIKGTILLHDVPRFLKITDPADRRRALNAYFKEHPDLICNDKYRRELGVA